MLQWFKRESRRFVKVFWRPTFLYLFVMGNIALLAATIAVHYFEQEVNPHMRTWFDAFWWGASTITAIGYGDVVPITVGGRLVALLLMYTGTILFVTFTGTLVMYWTRQEVELELNPLKREVRREEVMQERMYELLTDIEERLKRLEQARRGEF